jgi:TRAP-type C4-dicarboxylate transport system permease small subunit
MSEQRAPKLFKVFYSITGLADWIGYAGLAAIVLIVFVDVCGRFLLNKPLLGSIELVEQTMGFLAGFAMMAASAKHGHVALDLINERLSKGTQIIMQRIFSLLGAGISLLLAYRVFLRVFRDLQFDKRTMVLQLSTAPVTFVFAVGLFLCGLVLLIQTFEPVALGENSEGKEERINEP